MLKFWHFLSFLLLGTHLYLRYVHLVLYAFSFILPFPSLCFSLEIFFCSLSSPIFSLVVSHVWLNPSIVFLCWLYLFISVISIFKKFQVLCQNFSSCLSLLKCISNDYFKFYVWLLHYLNPLWVLFFSVCCFPWFWSLIIIIFCLLINLVTFHCFPDTVHEKLER